MSDISIFQGDERSIPFPITDENGAAPTFAGPVEFIATFLQGETFQNAKLTKTATINGPGDVSVLFTEADFFAVTPGVYPYQIREAGDAPRTWESGRLVVLRSLALVNGEPPPGVEVPVVVPGVLAFYEGDDLWIGTPTFTINQGLELPVLGDGVSSTSGSNDIARTQDVPSDFGEGDLVLAVATYGFGDSADVPTLTFGVPEGWTELVVASDSVDAANNYGAAIWYKRLTALDIGSSPEVRLSVTVSQARNFGFGYVRMNGVEPGSVPQVAVGAPASGGASLTFPAVAVPWSSAETFDVRFVSVDTDQVAAGLPAGFRYGGRGLPIEADIDSFSADGYLIERIDSLAAGTPPPAETAVVESANQHFGITIGFQKATVAALDDIAFLDQGASFVSTVATAFARTRVMRLSKGEGQQWARRIPVGAVVARLSYAVSSQNSLLGPGDVKLAVFYKALSGDAQTERGAWNKIDLPAVPVPAEVNVFGVEQTVDIDLTTLPNVQAGDFLLLQLGREDVAADTATNNEAGIGFLELAMLGTSSSGGSGDGSAAVAAHVAVSDPHTQYTTDAEAAALAAAAVAAAPVQEAPTDGNQYARQSEGWVQVAAGGAAVPQASFDVVAPATNSTEVTLRMLDGQGAPVTQSVRVGLIVTPNAFGGEGIDPLLNVGIGPPTVGTVVETLTDAEFLPGGPQLIVETDANGVFTAPIASLFAQTVYVCAVPSYALPAYGGAAVEVQFTQDSVVLAKDLGNVVAATYQSVSGIVFEQDGFTLYQFSLYFSPIAGTQDDSIYQREAFNTSGALDYAFAVPNGTYRVLLLFCENFQTAAGARVMSVAIEGVTVESGIDVFNEVGQFAALVKTYPGIVVSDGTLNISVSATVDSPSLCGILVLAE